MYLPSDSELHVSLWRLTDKRQVWYEWHAEAFLYLSSGPDGKRDSIASLRSSPQITAATSMTRRASGGGSHLVTSPPMGGMMNVASPLIDAVDIPLLEREEKSFGGSAGSSKDVGGIVKIGQTSLHNPGGRSSWIGL